MDQAGLFALLRTELTVTDVHCGVCERRRLSRCYARLE
jgi:hypothetical protein